MRSVHTYVLEKPRQTRATLRVFRDGFPPCFSPVGLNRVYSLSQRFFPLRSSSVGLNTHVVIAVASLQSLLVLQLRLQASVRRYARYFHCTVWSLHFDFWSARLRHHLGLLKRLFWLLARLCAFLWRRACWIRRQLGLTMLVSTRSCVCSKPLSLHALNLDIAPSSPLHAQL